MHRMTVNLIVIIACSLLISLASAQQFYRLPDIRSFKHLTSGSSDHAPDIPGKETTMDYYSRPNGQVYTVYSHRGRNVVFSVHSNSDAQKTRRLFMDMRGDGNFQEINPGTAWYYPVGQDKGMLREDRDRNGVPDLGNRLGAILRSSMNWSCCTRLNGETNAALNLIVIFSLRSSDLCGEGFFS